MVAEEHQALALDWPTGRVQSSSSSLSLSLSLCLVLLAARVAIIRTYTYVYSRQGGRPATVPYTPKPTT